MSADHELSHISSTGDLHMVDVSTKDIVRRTAFARGKIFLKAGTLDKLKAGALQKGDALACARVAGITAAKKASELIPLCHNIVLDQVSVDFEFQRDGVQIEARTICLSRTGVEMEVLTAVSVAALTIYDMCKAVDKQMVIGEIILVEKKKEPLA
jgi:cyclic pyranopterin phosphate synthase